MGQWVLINAGWYDTWAHPNAWAPFSLIGDGGH